MRSSLRSTSDHRSPSLAIAFAAAVLALAGCAQEGTTPNCTNNVGKDGIVVDRNGTGCENFGFCRTGNGIDPTAMGCCVDSEGNLLTGSALSTCLYGFGAACCDSIKQSASDPNIYVLEGCDDTAAKCCSNAGTDEAACLAGFRVGVTVGTGGAGGTTATGGSGGSTGP